MHCQTVIGSVAFALVVEQGNLLKGIDKKTGRKEVIEPIKRVFTYLLF